METRTLKALSVLRLKGNQQGNHRETISFPQEKSRETLEIIADAILQDACRKIQASGYWMPTPAIRRLEDEINNLYFDVVSGKASLENFKALVNQWTITKQ